MSALRAWVRRWTAFVLTSSAVIPFVTGLYIAAGIAFVVTDYTLNNEGLLTYYWASWARQDFIPVFFYQKVKPILCVLYAPVTVLGSHATLIAHVIVGAMTIPLMAATARSLGYRFANLPALIVALSPFYFYGGSAGFSNVDGVAGIALVFYLVCSRRQPILAGVVAGVLPWVRFELVTFSAVVALYALLTQRDRRCLVGMAIFPFVYAAAGAWYHHDLLWMAHFPPSAPFDPGNPIYAGQHIGLRYLLEPAVVLTPAVALVAALPVKRLTRFEQAVLVYALLTALTMNVLPIFRVGNFGSAQRYSLHLLPALALLAARAVEPWWVNERPRLVAMVGTLLLAVWVVTQQADALTTAILILLYVVMLAAAWWRAGTIAVTLAAFLPVIGLLLPLRIEAPRSVTAAYLSPMVAWLNAHPELRSAPIYTNAQLLAPVLERDDHNREIYFMPGIDMIRELTLLTNPDNGQSERIRRLCAMDLYGKTLIGSIAPDDLLPNALIVVRTDPRLSLLLPDATWAPRLEPLADAPLFRIARLRPDTGDRSDPTVARPGNGGSQRPQ